MDASKPDFEDGDVVLRTPEGTSFCVHRVFLSSASPFFKDLFSLPQPRPTTTKTEEDPEIPIIDISERGEVLEAILCFLYPFPDPVISSIDELAELLAVASKYEMVTTITRLSWYILSPKWGPESSLRLFALACQYEHELPQETIALAARYTLSSGLLHRSSLPKEFLKISAATYHRLLLLHRTRGRRAVSILREVDLSLEPELRCAQCSAPGIGYKYVNGVGQPKWWVNWLDQAEKELLVQPTTERVFSIAFLAESAKRGCPRCASSVLESHAFLTRLKEKIDALPDNI